MPKYHYLALIKPIIVIGRALKSDLKNGVPGAFRELFRLLYQLDFSDKEEKTLEEQLIITFNDAVETFPPKMKQVFLLCKIEGRQQKEVAEELGITLKTVEKHIASAKQTISEQLTRKYPLLSVPITLWLG